MKAFLYARVSTRDKGQDTENQLPEMRRFVETRGWQLRREYIDNAPASGKKVREQFDEMLDACDRHEADAIIIWALDRFTREGPLRALLLIDRLQRAGVRVKSMREPWLDPDSPTYELLLPIFAWIAKQESIRLGERVCAGMARARANGKHCGRPSLALNAAEITALRAQRLSWREVGSRVGAGESTVRKFMGKQAEKGSQKVLKSTADSKGLGKAVENETDTL